jgi:hypothetical protein
LLELTWNGKEPLKLIVNDDDVDLAGPDILQKLLQVRTVG